MASAPSPTPRPADSSLSPTEGGGYLVAGQSTAGIRQSIELDREAKRERRARVERQVQAALFEQRTEHANAVSGLKAQLLELKHQDEIAAIKQWAKTREHTLEAEIANLRRLLEDERNRRGVSEASAKKALDAQRADADRREAAHAAMAAELERRGAEGMLGPASSAELAALQTKIETLQQALSSARQANAQLRSEKEAALADRASATDERVVEVEALRFQLASANDKFSREVKRFEAERDRQTQALADLSRELEASRITNDEERRARLEDSRQAEKRLREAQEAADVAQRRADERVAAAAAEHQAAMRQMEVKLQEALKAKEQEADQVAKREAAEVERRAAMRKDSQNREAANTDALDSLQAEMQRLAEGWEGARAEFDKKIRAANEQRVKDLRLHTEAIEALRAEYDERQAAAAHELEEERARSADDKTAAERRHKETTATLNAKVRDAWAAAKAAEDRIHEGERALVEANSRVEAEAKAFSSKHQALLEAQERNQQRAKETAAAAEAAHLAEKKRLEEALAKEQALRVTDAENSAKLEAAAEARLTQQKKVMAESASAAKTHYEAAIRRLEDLLSDERTRREELARQKAALQEGMDVLNREYDDSVTAMELLEAQLRENRAMYEHEMAALTMEMERSRALRTNSVAAADAADAEVQALKTEVQVLKRKLKRNICSRCGGSGFPTNSMSVDPTAQLFYVASPSQATTAGGAATGDRRPPRGTPTTNGRQGHMWNSDDEGEDGKRYGASGDF